MHLILSFSFIPLLSLLVNAAPQVQVAPPPAAPTIASGFCKAVPGSPAWPSEADWTQLNTAVEGRLTAPDPPAAVCHSQWPAYDAAACSTLKSKWKDTATHANHPTSSMWQNYNNYSCMPEGNGCSASGYPVYVVAASNAEDVKAAVDFARTKRIRLNIKSTGHDFLGRSVQPNSLSIWTHNLKSKQWINSFIPEGCPPTTAIPGKTIYVGSGNQWGELNKAAREQQVMMVAGASSTVSVGGYLSNGGHGSLSAAYGLGADMVAEIELVTADGQIIKANECQNQDYFWAMRGGGGSTYGVATRFAIQTIPTVPTARWFAPLRSWDEIIYMHQHWPKLAAAGASGYINGYPGRSGSSSVSMTLPNATDRSMLEALMDPVMQGMSSGNRGSNDDDGETTQRLNRRTKYTKGTYSWHATWAEAQDTMVDADVAESSASFPGTGSNKIITSWLWSTEDCASAQVGPALRAAFKDGSTQLLNDMTMGVGTWSPPYLRGGSNAVNPAFRTATMRPAAEFQWTGADAPTLAKKQADALEAGTALKMVNPEGGTYANEADPSDPNWKKSFWGANYDRLAEIKAKVDPEGVFYCRACVGSDRWVDNEGVLCKV